LDPIAGMDRRTRRVAETLLARRRLFHRARRTLRDPARTALVFVLTPEKLPILETRRATLAAFELPVRGLVVNRVLPDEAEGAFLARRKQGGAGDLHGGARVHLPLLAEEVEGLPAVDRHGMLTP
jgi:arsenite/tail-anchored protein-transporting ATPase